jgi:hypothetical protein
LMTLYLMMGWVILATFSRKAFISGLASSTGSTKAWGTSLAPMVLAAAATAREVAVPPEFPPVAFAEVPVVAVVEVPVVAVVEVEALEALVRAVEALGVAVLAIFQQIQ